MLYWGPVRAIDEGIFTEDAEGKRVNWGRGPIVFSTYIIVVSFYTIGMYYIKRQKMFLVDQIKNS